MHTSRRARAATAAYGHTSGAPRSPRRPAPRAAQTGTHRPASSRSSRARARARPRAGRRSTPATAGSRPRCRRRSCRPGRSRTRGPPRRAGHPRRRCRARARHAQMRSLGRRVCLPRRRSLGARAARHIPGSARFARPLQPLAEAQQLVGARRLCLGRVGRPRWLLGCWQLRGLWDSRGLLGMRTWRPLDAHDRLNRFIDQLTERRSAGGGGRRAGGTAIDGAMLGADRDLSADPIAAIDRGQDALQLLQLALQLAQRLRDLLIHCPSVAALLRSPPPRWECDRRARPSLPAPAPSRRRCRRSPRRSHRRDPSACPPGR